MKNKHIARKKLTQEDIVKEVTALQDMGLEASCSEEEEGLLLLQKHTADLFKGGASQLQLVYQLVCRLYLALEIF